MKQRLRHLGNLVLACLLLSAGQSVAHELNPATVARAMQSVVSVLPQQISDRQRQEEPEGSGVVIGDGKTIVTAAHVLGASSDVLVRTTDGRVVVAKLIASDHETDIALLKLERPLPALEFAERLSVTQSTCAIGNGFGLGLSVTCGVVSALGRSGMGFNPVEDFVQTDAAVNPGMSGGALIDSEGQIIGILSAIFTKNSDANIGVNFAVSADLVKSVIADLGDNGKIDRKRSGLRLAQHNGTDETGMIGARVEFVRRDTPEQRAGMQPGDIILAANGSRIIRAPAYAAFLAKLKAGEKVKILLLRDGKPVELAVDFWQ